MADTERLPDRPCLRCASQAAAIPTDAQIRIYASEDWDPKTLAFVPQAMNQEQAVAAELLAVAIGRYARAFGIETAGARLSAALDGLRVNVIRHRITQRTLEARTDINDRARARYEKGDVDGARAIESEPTPDYPGKAKDDAWLGAR